MICDVTDDIKGDCDSLHACPRPFSIVLVNLDLLGRQVGDDGPQGIVATCLSDKEKEKFSLFRYDKRKLEWLGGRIAAKYAAWQIRKGGQTFSPGMMDFRRLEIAADQAGKPSVSWREKDPVKRQSHISISHSGNWAAALCSTVSCGIDIQYVTPTVERVRERFVTPAEDEIVRPISEIYGSRTALTCIWSAKEAVKKAWCGPRLPGFNEIRINGLQKEGKGIFLTAAVTGKAGEKRTRVMVWLDPFAEGVLAFTMTDEEENEKNQ